MNKNDLIATVKLYGRNKNVVKNIVSDLSNGQSVDSISLKHNVSKNVVRSIQRVAKESPVPIKNIYNAYFQMKGGNRNVNALLIGGGLFNGLNKILNFSSNDSIESDLMIIEKKFNEIKDGKTFVDFLVR